MSPQNFPLSFKYLIVLIFLTIFLLSAVVFNLWYPNGFEDLLINQQWRDVPHQPTRYRGISTAGKMRMKKSSVTIVGVGKDVASRLPSFLPQVEFLASEFNYSQAAFVEGDSSDNSRTLLMKWAAKSPKNRTVVTVASANDKDSIGVFKGLMLPREGKLSIARNHALDVVRKLPPTDFVVMVDMDVIGWNIYGVRDSFGRSSWDVICANGIIMHGMYRDTYAFRSKGLDTNHHKGGMDHDLYNVTESQRTKNRETVRSSKQRVREMMDISSADGKVIQPFEVESCFGGLAIYRYAAMDGCQYSYREAAPPNMLDCEHVLFHKCLREKNKARIFSNPHMKLWYGHAPLQKLKWSDILPGILPA